jgi:hypothetical protein
MIAVYLWVNLYKTASVTMYMTAEIASWAATSRVSSRVVGVVWPMKPTLAPRMSIATMAITPTTEPQTPSKNAARNFDDGAAGASEECANQVER